MDSGEYDDDNIWGATLLPEILKAIGGAEGTVTTIRLHFEYGCFATAIIEREGLPTIERLLSIHGTTDVSRALCAPDCLQAITLDVEPATFAIANCRYIPLRLAADRLTQALQASGVYETFDGERRRIREESL